jgi:hypothetical protein
MGFHCFAKILRAAGIVFALGLGSGCGRSFETMNSSVNSSALEVEQTLIEAEVQRHVGAVRAFPGAQGFAALTPGGAGRTDSESHQSQ